MLPVHLRLFAGAGLVAHGGAPRGRGALVELGEETAHEVHAAGVAPRLQLGQKLHRRQADGGALAQVVAMIVEFGLALPGLRRAQPFRFEDRTHGVARMTGQPRDLAHGMTLPFEKMDIPVLERREHAAGAFARGPTS